MEWLADYWNSYGELLLEGTWDSIVMTGISVFFAYVLGVPLGVLVVLTAKGGLHPHRALNAVLSWVINIGRSIPFIILMFAIIPFTRMLVGTSLGVPGAVVPLTVTAIPFVARMVEQSLTAVDPSLVEAGQSFGANTWQIVCKVYLRESLPSLIRGAAITFVTLFGFAAMAGCVGAGGLGDIAIRYGYQRWQPDVMVGALLLCIVVVQVAQSLGDWLADRVNHKVR